jgi:hypothetical protein
MPEVVTIVTAFLPPDRIDDVIAEFGATIRAGLLPERRHTSLLRGEENMMRIITVWRSRADLDHYLATTAHPFAVSLLRRFGGSPVVDIHELVLDSTTAWWP